MGLLKCVSPARSFAVRQRSLRLLLFNGSRLSQVAKAADGAKDGRVPPIAVETQKQTHSWSVADDDNSVYFLLKQVNYFRLKHVFLAKKKKKKKRKKPRFIAPDKHSWFTMAT